MFNRFFDLFGFKGDSKKNSYAFKDYEIQIVASNNYPDKFVAWIEEFHGVIETIDNKSDAAEKLRPLFDKEIIRLKSIRQLIPEPGSGKAKITYASRNKTEKLSPFIDEFWEKVFNASYSDSFVSDESCFNSWLHYCNDDKNEFIAKVNKVYSVDISSVYERPIHEVLVFIINSKK